MAAQDRESVEGQPDRIELLEEELEEQKAAHPLELFFDLVCVFAITQVVSRYSWRSGTQRRRTSSSCPPSFSSRP